MRSRGDSFRNALELHVLFAYLAHHKYARAAPAIQKPHFGAGFRAQNLPQMPGFLPLQEEVYRPSVQGPDKKTVRSCHHVFLAAARLAHSLEPVLQ